MKNALTIDVEDYFQVTAFSSVVDRKDWSVYPSRVVDSTRRVLEILSAHGIHATFFVLGWVAEQFPMLVRDISNAGHEVACHGFSHQLIFELTPDEFRQDIRLAKNTLEDITGKRILGYRAPSYSITNKSLWALDILLEEGFVYDSSIFPVYHDTYGIPGSERFPHELKLAQGSLFEFPMSTLNIDLLGKQFALPIAGGGYLRLFPAAFIRWAITRINNVSNKPAVLYFHPWEIDPEQPRIHASFKSVFRHYLNLRYTEGKLSYLFAELEFDTMVNTLGLNAVHDFSAENDEDEGQTA